MSDEAPLVITIKVDGGGSMPWIVLRSSNPQQAQQDLDAIAASGLADSIGRAHAAVNAGFNAGNVLGARTEQAPVQPQQPSAGPGWEQGPPPAFAQPQAAAPYQQQPAQAYAQAAANGYQQQAPAPQYQPPAAPAATVPGAPLVMGQPAKLIQSKPGAARAWQAFADPRPKAVTDGLEATADPNDPGLQTGLKKLWMFLK